MSRHGLYRRTIILLVLVVTLVSLIPVHTVDARPLRVDDTTAVRVDAAKVRDIVWIANALYRIPAGDRATIGAYMLVLQQLYRENPGLSSTDAVQRITALRTAYDASLRSTGGEVARSPHENLFAVFSVLTAPPLDASPSAGAVALAARRAFSLALERPEAGYAWGDDRIAAANELNRVQLATTLEQILLDSLALGAQNATYRTAFNTLWASLLRVNMLASIDQLKQSNPQLQVASIAQLIKADGTVNTTVGTINGVARTLWTDMFDVLVHARSTLKTIDAQQTDLHAYATDPAKQAANEAATKAQAEQDKKDLEQAKTVLEVLGNLLGQVDPKTGKAFSTMTKAVDTIAKAVTEYMETIAKLGGIPDLTSLATMAMTANIIGAILTVFALFADSGPSPEQIILQQIAELRKQVDKLRTEMHARFDRIDRSLNIIYATLIDRFNKIDVQLGRITTDLHEIQTALVEIQKTMFRFERNMFDILSDGFRRSLWDDINGCVGYEERTGATMGYQPEYVDCENVFQTWATIHAYDLLATGPSSRPLDDDQLANELGKYPLDTNINFVSQFVSGRWGLPAFAGSHLANPRDWAIGSRAYAELSTDWPAHAARINPTRVAAIDSTGASIRQALRTISTVDTANGPRGNRQYFNRAITNYREKAAAFVAALEAIEATFLADLQVSLERQTQIGLWGGPSQTIEPADQPTFPTLLPCSGTQFIQLASPSNLIQNWFPRSVGVASYFKLGTHSACFTADWEDERYESYGPSYRRIDMTFAQLRVSITSKWDDGTVMTRSLKLPETRSAYCRSDVPSSCYSLEPHEEARTNWTQNENVKGTFELYSTLLSSDSTLIAAITNAANDALIAQQRNLYRTIINELAATTPVSGAARRLTGAKAMIDALMVLGLPRALDGDEYLHSLIFGSQRLLDEDDEQRFSLLYAAGFNRPPSNNVRRLFMVTMDQRIADLQTAIERHLQLIDTGAYAESQRLVETTLDRSLLAGRLVRKPIATIAASSLAFAPQFTGTTSPVRSFTIKSEGLATPLTNVAISLAGANAADFVQTNTCPATLAIGALCTVNVSFKPGTAGARQAVLRIASNAAGSPRTVALSGTATIPAPAGNLQLNAGFEQDTNSDTRPDTWTVNANVTRSNALKHGGTYAMRHSANNDASYSIEGNTITNLVPGASYGVSAWVNIPAASDPDGFIFQLVVQWRDTTNTLVATTPVKTYTDATEGWNNAATTLIVPPNATSATIRMMVSSLRGTLYVDDVFWGNLLENSGFELDRDNNQRPDNWSVDSHVYRTLGAARHGSYGMRHYATEDATYSVTQPVASLVAGRSYAFDGSVRIPAISDAFTAKFEMQWRNASNAVISTTPIKTYSTHTGGTWNMITASLLAPTGTTNGVLRINVTSFKGDIYMDSFTLRP